MARVFVDVNIFSDAWFSPVLGDLIKSKNVQFVFGTSALFQEEQGRVRKALELYKILGQMKAGNGQRKRIDVEAEELERHQAYIDAQQCFIGSADCDDPHIFALLYLKPTHFVFSNDARLAACRDHINQFVDSRYCDFIIISAAATYAVHKHAIHH